MRNFYCLLVLVLILVSPRMNAQTPATFSISVAKDLQLNATHGRVFIYLSRNADDEPRNGINTDNLPKSGQVYAKDVSWDATKTLAVDKGLLGFPMKEFNRLDSGTWYVQAVYDIDTMHFENTAPGNYYSEPLKVNITGKARPAISLVLSKQFKEEAISETKYIKHIRIQSKLLTDFWHRPMFVEAGILLPEGYDSSSSTRYPVRYRVGGYGSHWSRINNFLRNPVTKKMWTDTASTVPRMIMVYLDCEAPFGDSYQMNSENNGPYNDVLIKELIPYVEQRYKAIGTANARFVDGGSTGGWVSLALQVFNPDTFNGCWSFYGDPVDFHFFQLVNIYGDKNAFMNRFGNENPSVRTTHGEPVLSIRNEVLYEAVLGRGNNFITSGSQWGGWNAVYSPRGANGKPKAIWDSFTGVIDTSVAAYWKRWDLNIYLKEHWSELGPKLQGKLHIWMGDMDNYYLNEAMRLLQRSLAGTTAPKSDAGFTFGPMMGHGWEPLSEEEKMRQMLQSMK